VDDVLDMTRIEQGKLELVNEPFNILVELHSALQQVAMGE
jgi:signal transduction histidine kinase